MYNVFDIFQERGFIEQVSDRDQLRDLLKSPITCYIGFDPTAKSFHVGSLLSIISLIHMQRAGHRPIVVLGGGTGLVGDPSGKSEMRRVMSREEIDENAHSLKSQLSRFLNFDEGKAIMVNNAEWLVKLGYIEFLRDIGRHFSVNRMLAQESYKARLKTGLSFVEFNYMLLQAYDFWYLFRHYDCRLQMGGNDQWGNILAGIELVRRLEGEDVHALTFPLLTTSSGVKMGKTQQGAVWLDPDLTSPYEFYQYWINQDDQDIERLLSLFTFIPMEEVRRLGRMEGADLRESKEVLAYEVTKLCHGKDAANKARDASRELFGEQRVVSSEYVPTCEISAEVLEKGVPAYQLFQMSQLCKTRSDARRLISQGGAYVNGERIRSFDQVVDMSNLRDNSMLLRAGKKKYMRITLS